ncbi:hypothetical protein DPSP01_005402 [Paraphaeosphaeria sporulosa]|uniref:Uncharacterized protein n=1 Tax=Paraphaeosphaeria sporulosa TaxID=1460663 RepID=A0A177CC19_9PLEO|nr:uncharacterized protein CC84DRAFT_1093173 [Paraphaeosphaeria sporulosa]OAG05194.1 hypothetical protein CC84DRAFT_1093173 [Paraphaeosphaeria sporulosa]
MAGRILPIALATFAGVAIGVSTFGEEFKEQQRRRLQQEYNRDLASAGASALPTDGPSPMASSTIPAPQPEQLPAQTEPANQSKLSSMLGFWAWSSERSVAKEKSPARTSSDGSKPQP